MWLRCVAITVLASTTVVALGLRFFLLAGFNPDCVEVECRVFTRYAFKIAKHLPRVNGHFHTWMDLAFTDWHVH